MGFLVHETQSFHKLSNPRGAEVLAILRQDAGAGLTGLERQMFGEVLLQCLLLSKGQMALALAVVLQTEEREPFN